MDDDDLPDLPSDTAPDDAEPWLWEDAVDHEAEPLGHGIDASDTDGDLPAEGDDPRAEGDDEQIDALISAPGWVDVDLLPSRDDLGGHDPFAGPGRTEIDEAARTLWSRARGTTAPDAMDTADLLADLVSSAVEDLDRAAAQILSDLLDEGTW